MNSEHQKPDIPETEGQKPGIEAVRIETLGLETTDSRPDAAGGQKDSTEAKPGVKGKSEDGEGKPSENAPVYTNEEFESKFYKKFSKMGRVLIINNLSGTLKDTVKLEEKLSELRNLLTSMGFEAISKKDWVKAQGIKHVDYMEFQNVSVGDIVPLMRDASMDDYGEHHCFLTIILTHGKDGVLEFEPDKPANVNGIYPKVEVTTLQECFKDKPTLNMKPKLFFIQAGERPGEKTDHYEGRKEEVTVKKIPREADFFSYTYELPFLGELLFLEVLTKALKEFVKEKMDKGEEPLEINKLTIRMNGMIGDMLKDKHTLEFNDHDMRIPCVTSLLTKNMNFNYGERRKP